MISALRLGPRQLVHQLGPQVFDQLGHRITHGFDAARQIPLGPSIGSVMQHEMDDVLASQEKMSGQQRTTWAAGVKQYSGCKRRLRPPQSKGRSQPPHLGSRD